MLSLSLEVGERKIRRQIFITTSITVFGARGFFIDEKITWEIPSVFIIVLSGIVPPRWRRTGEEIWWLKGGEDLELGRREQSRR